MSSRTAHGESGSATGDPGASGAPPVSASVPYDRIAPQDFYRQLDWLRDEWAPGPDEWPREVPTNGKKVARLRRLFDRLPDRFHEQAQPHLRFLALHIDYKLETVAPALAALGLIVSEWGRSRTTG